MSEFLPESELAEPQKLLNYLLQPSISRLHSDTIAVYIQAATKVFGFWSSELAQRWDDDDLPRVKETVDFVLDHLRDFVASPDIEVQERVCGFLHCEPLFAKLMEIGLKYLRIIHIHPGRLIRIPSTTAGKLRFWRGQHIELRPYRHNRTTFPKEFVPHSTALLVIHPEPRWSDGASQHPGARRAGFRRMDRSPAQA